jgi:prolipoprotein diacylglyceryltransferase
VRQYVVAWLSSWIGPNAAAILAPTWFTMTGLAGLVVSVLVVRAARRNGDDVAVAVRAVLIAYVAAILGGIVIPMVADMLMRLVRGGGLRVRWAGMVSYCGFLAGLAAAALVLRRSSLSLARFGDLVAAPLGLGIAVTRLGCFVAGCDYGQVSAVPWALRFPSGSPAWSAHVHNGLMPATRDASLPVHPTQLYEAFLGVLIFVIACGLARVPWARRQQGRVFWSVAAVYGAGRLLIEMVRGDVSRGLVGALSSAQIFALLLAAVAVVALWRVRRVGRAPAAALAAVLAVSVLIPAPAAHADTGEAAAAPAPRKQVEVGLLLGTALPVNRRSSQVPQLGGGALSGSLEISPDIDVGLDLDSMANSVATHVTVATFAGMRRKVNPKLTLGVRGGFGFTLVDFTDQSFADALALNVRVEGTAAWALSDKWQLLVRPLSIDFINATELGGPIVTYQFRVGVSYRFGVGRQAPAPAAAPAPAPAPAAPATPAPATPATPEAPPEAETPQDPYATPGD